MGREVKRVPIEFDWPQKTTWWGYIYSSVVKLPCRTCRGTGKVPWRSWSFHKNEEGPWDCPHCEGEDHVYLPSVEPPKGNGYQMWETTSEGSPISPVFATPEKLARWLTDTEASAFGPTTATYESWLGMIRGPGWAPTAVMEAGILRSGVEAMAEIEATPEEAP